MKPLFSVIIPIFNRRNFFKKCIDSVLCQTYQNFELFIIDDGSTDGTISFMSEYTGKSVNYIRIKHGGVSVARNIGIILARGEYVAFLDSDDIWDPRKLEITLNEIKNSPSIKIFHTDEIWHKGERILGQKNKHKKPTGYVYERCVLLCCIGMSTAVVKRSLFDEIGFFDENLPACEDYDLWLRTCHKYEVKLIPEALTIKYGGRADQLSNQPGLDRFRIYSLKKMIDSNMLNKNQELHTKKELVKKCKIYITGALKRGKKEESEYYRQLIESYQL